MVAVGLACFAGFVVLLAFSRGPSVRDGGTHALSRSAVGFAGLVALLKDTGAPVLISREPARAGGGPNASLLVLTPSAGSKGPQTFPDMNAGAVLIVLPKWRTDAMDAHPGWVEAEALLPSRDVLGVLPEDWAAPKLKRHDGTTRPALLAAAPLRSPPATNAIDRLQTLSAPRWTAVLSDRDGGIVLGQAYDDGPYVLSDPDLLNDLAMAELPGAQGALDLIGALSDGAVAFDVSLNGFGRSRDPLLLIFQPPLLGATLCAVAAALLIGLVSARRFGPARAAGRAFDLGKRVLAENSAALIARARREPRMARPYAELTRHLAARAVAAPRQLGTAALDAFLDRAAAARGGTDRFGPMLAEAGAVRDGAGLVRLARRLHRWRMGLVHGHR